MIKNALDWLVSSTEFPGKAVALINTNPRATIAQDSLKEILTTMSAHIIESANLTLAIAGRGLDEQGIIADRELSAALQQAIAIFIQSICQHKNQENLSHYCSDIDFRHKKLIFCDRIFNKLGILRGQKL